LRDRPSTSPPFQIEQAALFRLIIVHLLCLHKLLAAAGIDTGVRFHDLRHTFATLAMQSGVDAKTLASMLGHYSAGFTLDTYTHVTHQMQQGAADKIGGFMEGAMATTPEPEPPEPTSENRCKVIPFAQAM